jgi:hypothetical protein
MEYIIPLVLTMSVLSSIIYIVVKITDRGIKQVDGLDLKHRQSTIHNIVRSVLPTNEEIIANIIRQKRRSSQTKQSKQKYNPDQIKVLVVGDKAYWIQDNTFYETNVDDNGEIDQASSKPVDTTNLNDDEINMLMEIVDELGRVENNDGGSSGN